MLKISKKYISQTNVVWSKMKNFLEYFIYENEIFRIKIIIGQRPNKPAIQLTYV